MNPTDTAFAELAEQERQFKADHDKRLAAVRAERDRINAIRQPIEKMAERCRWLKARIADAEKARAVRTERLSELDVLVHGGCNSDYGLSPGFETAMLANRPHLVAAFIVGVSIDRYLEKTKAELVELEQKLIAHATEHDLLELLDSDVLTSSPAPAVPALSDQSYNDSVSAEERAQRAEALHGSSDTRPAALRDRTYTL